MKDALHRELEIGDIIVRITDFGASRPFVLESKTLTGQLRTLFVTTFLNTKKGFTFKVTSNLLKLDEELLSECLSSYVGSHIKGVMIDKYLEISKKIKEEYQ